jgi:hypothetical protein
MLNIERVQKAGGLVRLKPFIGAQTSGAKYTQLVSFRVHDCQAIQKNDRLGKLDAIERFPDSQLVLEILFDIPWPKSCSSGR